MRWWEWCISVRQCSGEDEPCNSVDLHALPLKHDIISCLAVGARWITSTPLLQVCAFSRKSGLAFILLLVAVAVLLCVTQFCISCILILVLLSFFQYCWVIGRASSLWCSSMEDLLGPGLTQSTLWKNRPVKEKLKVESIQVLLYHKWWWLWWCNMSRWSLSDFNVGSEFCGGKYTTSSLR